MLSLLQRPQSKMNKESVATEKLASRVGASLLTNIGLDELIVPSMGEYEAVMTRCVSEPEWFSTITERLRSARDTSPLFDTERWVRNLEAGLTEVVQNKEDNNSDVYAVEDAYHWLWRLYGKLSVFSMRGTHTLPITEHEITSERWCRTK